MIEFLCYTGIILMVGAVTLAVVAAVVLSAAWCYRTYKKLCNRGRR